MVLGGPASAAERGGTERAASALANLCERVTSCGSGCGSRGPRHHFVLLLYSSEGPGGGKGRRTRRRTPQASHAQPVPSCSTTCPGTPPPSRPCGGSPESAHVDTCSRVQSCKRGRTATHGRRASAGRTGPRRRGVATAWRRRRAGRASRTGRGRCRSLYTDVSIRPVVRRRADDAHRHRSRRSLRPRPPRPSRPPVVVASLLAPSQSALLQCLPCPWSSERAR